MLRRFVCPKRASSSAGSSARLISVRSEVQILPGPPSRATAQPSKRGWPARLTGVVRPTKRDCADQSSNGGIAQLGERLLCKQEVVGSIPSASTINLEHAPELAQSSFFDIVYLKRSESLKNSLLCISQRQGGGMGRSRPFCCGGRPLHGTSRRRQSQDCLFR